MSFSSDHVLVLNSAIVVQLAQIPRVIPSWNEQGGQIEQKVKLYDLHSFFCFLDIYNY